jgi:hypothetical protein
MGISGYARAALTPGKKHGSHCTGGWEEDTETGLEGSEKFPPPPAFDTRTFQPVASRRLQ